VPQRFIWFVAGLTVAAGFGFMGTLPAIVDYVVIGGGLIGLVCALIQRDAVLGARASLMLCLALVLLLVSVPWVYRGPIDLLPFFAAAPLLAAPGIAWLLSRSTFWLKPDCMPLLCLFGAVSAAGLGVLDHVVAGTPRVGLGNNPIHYGGIVTILGFLALPGAAVGSGRWRLLYLLGPVAGFAAVMVSGSRGPLLAWIVLAVLCFPLLLLSLKRRKLVLMAAGAMLVAFAILVVWAGDSLLGARIVDMAQAAINAGASSPWGYFSGLVAGTDAARLALYDTAIHAFRLSPLFGIGYGQIMPLAHGLYPDLKALHGLEHLHSDAANFAAIAGSLGLIAFVLVQFSPLAALHGAAPRRNIALLMSALVLAIGYLALGLTNAMFGVLPQTTLFALALGYVMALGRNVSRASST